MSFASDRILATRQKELDIRGDLISFEPLSYCPTIAIHAR